MDGAESEGTGAPLDLRCLVGARDVKPGCPALKLDSLSRNQGNRWNCELSVVNWALNNQLRLREILVRKQGVDSNVAIRTRSPSIFRRPFLGVRLKDRIFASCGRASVYFLLPQ